MGAPETSIWPSLSVVEFRVAKGKFFQTSPTKALVLSFLPPYICEIPWVRAELVLGLLRLARFDDAVEASLPLIGGEFAAWFLYARAWQAWRQEEPHRHELLRAALQMRGSSDSAVVDFLTVEGKPLLSKEFSPRAAPIPSSRPTLCELRTPQMLTTPGQAEQLHIYVHPLLFVCVTGSQEAVWDTGDPEIDPWGRLVLQSMDQQRLREALALRLLRLALRYPHRVAVATSAAFYLILTQRYEEALGVCQRCLRGRPYLSVLRALEILCLYRSGRRYRAQQRGAELLANLRRDTEGLGSLVLGALAAEEGAFEVAARFFEEAAARGSHNGALLSQSTGRYLS